MSTSPSTRDRRSRDDLVRELEYWRRGGSAREIGQTCRYVVVAAAVLGIAYFGKEAVIGVATQLAGQTTKADIAYKLLSDMSFSIGLSWAVGLAGAGMAFRERRLRKRTVANLTKRNTALELKLDPHRTSSNLTSEGRTNPEDE